MAERGAFEKIQDAAEEAASRKEASLEAAKASAELSSAADGERSELAREYDRVVADLAKAKSALPEAVDMVAKAEVLAADALKGLDPEKDADLIEGIQNELATLRAESAEAKRLVDAYQADMERLQAKLAPEGQKHPEQAIREQNNRFAETALTLRKRRDETIVNRLERLPALASFHEKIPEIATKVHFGQEFAAIFDPTVAEKKKQYERKWNQIQTKMLEVSKGKLAQAMTNEEMADFDRAIQAVVARGKEKEPDDVRDAFSPDGVIQGGGAVRMEIFQLREEMKNRMQNRLRTEMNGLEKMQREVAMATEEAFKNNPDLRLAWAATYEVLNEERKKMRDASEQAKKERDEAIAAIRGASKETA